jgi:hypothetical protein
MSVEWEPDPSSGKGEGFTKTHLLLSVIAIIGLAILYQVTRLPDGHPHKECETLFGVDRECRFNINNRELLKAH